ncbi:hypothetical protein FRX31_020812 [Thalictrum thalictroides]|uniref:Uncharacterized protein n=1 Tax=Thalictrum thalictroides TaxID=46969 RepID=A0A7J6VXQ0_THATH|nr:hypothetical protein FRX31_020812 [Thalictrum thalictroides]
MSYIAHLDTSNVPPDVESVKSDDDESFFIVDRTWATLFRLSRHWKTEKLNLLGQIVDLDNLNVEAESRCKVLSKELDDVKTELLRLRFIARNTSSVSCEFPPLPVNPTISSPPSSIYVHALPMRGSLRPFQRSPRQGQGSRSAYCR